MFLHVTHDLWMNDIEYDGMGLGEQISTNFGGHWWNLGRLKIIPSNNEGLAPERTYMSN